MESEKMLSILMVIDKADRTGGYEKQARSLIEELKKQPDIIVHSLVSVKTRDISAPQGTKEIRMPAQPVLAAICSLVRVPLFFLRLRHCDIVHIHAVSFFGMTALLCARFKRIRTIVKIPSCGYLYEMAEKRSFKSRIYTMLLKQADRLVAVSAPVLQEILDCAYRADAAVLIPNGVDTERFRPPTKKERAAARSKLSMEDGTVIVLSVGRLEWRKGQETLLCAWDAMLKSSPDIDAVLYIVGDGEDREQLESYVKDHELMSSVRFEGVSDNVLTYYHGADIFVLPSVTEGSPNVLLEAAASGMPCISTKVGGLESIFMDGQDILFCDVKDSVALSDLLLDIISDKRKRAHLARSSTAKCVERFSLDEVCVRYIDLYSAMINDSGEKCNG